MALVWWYFQILFGMIWEAMDGFCNLNDYNMSRSFLKMNILGTDVSNGTWVRQGKNSDH